MPCSDTIYSKSVASHGTVRVKRIIGHTLFNQDAIGEGKLCQ